MNVSLAIQSATGGDAEGDHFTSIENVLGSFYNDTITGDGAANKLEGGAGNDTIYGGTVLSCASFQRDANGLDHAVGWQVPRALDLGER